MERLTIRKKGVPIADTEKFGDLCSKLPWLCHDFECNECPLGRIIDRLCEYEDTGLTPSEIVKLKEKKNTTKVRRCDRENHTTLLTTKVTENGVLIRETFYYSTILLFRCFDKDVDIYINEHRHQAEVYYHNELIEFFNLCPCTRATREDIAKRDEVAKAIKYAKEVTSQTHRYQ